MLQSSQAGRADVDALLRGITRPLAPDESPRSRADFLLALCTSRHVSAMKGSTGESMKAAAVQALMNLGHPYALEIPPDALRAHSRGGSSQRKIPKAGLILFLLGMAITLLMSPPWSVLPIIAFAPAMLGIKQGSPRLHKAGALFLALLSGGALVLAGYLFHANSSSQGSMFPGLTGTFAKLSLGVSCYLALGFFALAPHQWFVWDEESTAEDDKQP